LGDQKNVKISARFLTTFDLDCECLSNGSYAALLWHTAYTGSA